jgi:hypothetical protein
MASPPRFGAGRGCAKRGVKPQSPPRRSPPDLKLAGHVRHASPRSPNRSDEAGECCGGAAWAIRPHADPNGAPHAESFPKIKIVAVAAPCPIKYMQLMHAKSSLASPPRFGPACSAVAHSQDPVPALHPRPWPLLIASRTLPGIIRSCLSGDGGAWALDRGDVA